MASFADEKVSISLQGIRGRTSSSSASSASVHHSHSMNVSADQSINTSCFEQRADLVVCTLKLFAVRDKDQKLIGVVNFLVDYRSQRTLLKDCKELTFQKCIDPSATITISAKLVDCEPVGATTSRSTLQQVHSRLSTCP